MQSILISQLPALFILGYFDVAFPLGAFTGLLCLLGLDAALHYEASLQCYLCELSHILAKRSP